MILQTTLSLAAAAVFINLWLFVRIVRVRMAERLIHGDGGNALLLQRMRAQSNFIEHTPLFLILVAVIEMTGKGHSWLAIVGSVFMLARVAHGFGMDRTSANPYRAVGMVVTLLSEIGLAVVAVLIALQVM
ncbi:MAPEG family protein [Novosphingobium sp. M1R2S20]|uniref:MAPEG family protein n=1 Tax=Novosphingobium rhizovicinum TaxID=3228928 RepID=A0ABV3RFW0_9SPHN